MAGHLLSRMGAARVAWTDLADMVRSHPQLAVVAVLACTATSLANMGLNPPADASTAAVARGFGLALIEPLLLTPVLLAAHRYIILGETTRTYVAALSTRRFRRFFLLSAAMIAVLFAPVLLARPFFSTDVVAGVLVAGTFVSLTGTTLLGLMFPAIAVDAPGARIGNALADLWGNVWRLFWVSMLAMLPLMLLALLTGFLQALAAERLGVWPARLAFAPLEGALVAAIYLLLVLIASRFYAALADRLAQAA